MPPPRRLSPSCFICVNLVTKRIQSVYKQFLETVRDNPYGHSGLVKFTVLAESLVALSYFLVSVPPHARLQWALPSPPSKGVLHHTQLSLCCPSCCLLAACHEPPASSGLLAQPCAVSLRPLCSTGTDGMSLRVTWNPAALFFCSCFRG